MSHCWDCSLNRKY